MMIMMKTPIMVSMFLFLHFIGTCIPAPQPAPVPQSSSCLRTTVREKCIKCSGAGCYTCCDDSDCLPCDSWTGLCTYECCGTVTVCEEYKPDPNDKPSFDVFTTTPKWCSGGTIGNSGLCSYSDSLIGNGK